MRRILLITTAGLLVLVLVAAAVSYSWTFTPLGRLDYRAALLAKLASSQEGAAELGPEARGSANAFTARMLPDVGDTALARIEDREIAGPEGTRLPLRIYWPDVDGPLPLYLDVHGGGWWMGDGFLFHALMARFAARSQAIVVSVDYRLAPEHPYPAALDDCEAALVWMHENAAALGADPDRIAVGGGSAGGNLAAALALRVRDLGGPKISFQYLMVPVTDLSGTREWPSYRETGEDYVLKVSGMEQMIAAYVPDREMRASPYVSPLLAEDHKGLPPALVVTALFDPLRDEGEAYARALEAAGVPTRLHREDGALHGFLGSPARSLRIQAMAADAVREALLP